MKYLIRPDTLMFRLGRYDYEWHRFRSSISVVYDDPERIAQSRMPGGELSRLRSLSDIDLKSFYFFLLPEYRNDVSRTANQLLTYTKVAVEKRFVTDFYPHG